MPQPGPAVIVGFDSAWSDHPRRPGAIAACVFEHGGVSRFHAPRPAGFDQALALIEAWSSGASYLLVAIDQATVVSNPTGSRPVERVAGSIVCKLKGAVRPARRQGRGAASFGDQAPIWRFLTGLRALQHPIKARSAQAGRFVMEVAPNLSLPAMIPELWARGQGARYNPAARTFRHADWGLVAEGAAAFAENLQETDLAAWLRRQGDHPGPGKSEHDAIDAAICLCIALAWRRGAPECLLLGTIGEGYVVTATSAAMTATLAAAALRRRVALYQPLGEDAAGAAPEPAP